MLLKAKVLPDVVMMTNEALGEMAKVPALVLYLPRIVEPGARNSRGVERDLKAGTAVISPPPHLVDVEFDYEIVADNIPGAEGIWRLIQRMLAVLKATPRLAVNLTDDAGKPAARGFRVSHTGITTGRLFFEDQLLTARGSVTIHDVEIPPLPEEIRIAKLVQQVVARMYSLKEGGSVYAENTSRP